MMNTIIDPHFLGEMFLQLIRYIPVTLGLAASSMLLASILGIMVMVIRIKRIPVLSRLADLYVLLGRALPTMIVLYIVFFGLPVALMLLSETTGRKIEFNQIPAMTFAVIGLTISTGAYLSEIFRAAVQSVDKGQMEAALSVGMTWWQGFCRILLRQAAVFALPLMANQFLNLLKNTSIAFMITVMELFGAATVLSASTNRYLEIYIVVSLIYWGMSIIFEKIFLVVEDKVAFFKRGIQP
ncbi:MULTISPECIES: amino acid ABC transporter permease [Sporomusa]|jgi:His/Glu/Gln/Arg/opine family amino acid ABC transporter permease subunit|uniref:amino acid ABC transporter permease n=1 Tax=Sporomusa TaxID=2375 RepID=UPI002BC6F1AC|nr:amino acid ABC transporter permease [Sporomusa sphaeroides]HML32247.1 amino acid ABC transporter permease [Sporomusa sphaeroides]